MSLADRVATLTEQPYSRYEKRTWADMFPKTNLSALEPSKTLSTPSGSLATDKEEVLKYFGVSEKLEEIRDRFWQSGILYKTPDGYVLTDGFNEPLPRSTQQYSYGAPPSSIRVDSGSGAGIHATYEHVAAIPAGWDINTRWYMRAVRHTLAVQAVQIPSVYKVKDEKRALISQFLGDNPANLPSQYGLLLAIDVHPMLYLSGAQDRSITAYRRRITAIDTILAISSLQGNKYSTPKDAYADRSSDDHRYWLDNMLKIQHPSYIPSRDDRREYGRNYYDFFPWALLLNSSDAVNVDSFLAEYIVDFRFDLRSLAKRKEEVRQTIDLFTWPYLANVYSSVESEERSPFARRFLTPGEARIYWATVGTKDYNPDLYKDTMPPYRFP